MGRRPGAGRLPDRTRGLYRDRDGVATIEFLPTKDAPAVANTFRMLLDGSEAFDGIVMWSQGVARPTGILMRNCPEGDVTGEELAACTVWQGVIYISDSAGRIDLLPAEGENAPEKLLFPDLGYAVSVSSAYAALKLAREPWDVFAFQECQKVREGR